MADSGSERRNAARFSLIDTVQFTEVRTDTKWKVRISDLSLTGCYIETMNPPPEGTEIRVRFTLRGQPLEVQARVVRCEPNMGMGVLFAELEPATREIIEKHLAQNS